MIQHPAMAELPQPEGLRQLPQLLFDDMKPERQN